MMPGVYGLDVRGTRRPWYLVVAVVAIMVLVFSVTSGHAQGTGATDGERAIDRKYKSELIDSVTVALHEVYVFPDVAKEMEKHVRKRMKDKAYDEFKTVPPFLRQLTLDLQEISKDLHLHVDFASDEEIVDLTTEEPTEEQLERYRRAQQRGNYGFKSVQLLDGNVGYVDLRGFSGSPDAGLTAIAAMNFVAYADAIIFDMRQNGGGSPSMIQLLSSYLFEEPVHLNSFYIRMEDTIKQFWTSAFVQGPRITEADVYVLTSGRTFSAAEEFTYNLKNMGRATIVGETTGGGAHPVDGRVFPNLNASVSLPFGRAINPITGTNWEGTGVTPHIEVPQAEALDAAHLDALQKILARADDDGQMGALEWGIQGLKAKRNPVEVGDAILARYPGVYGPRTITFEDGALYYQREGRPKFRMIPMTNDLFRFDEIDYFRLRVVVDDSGEPLELVGLYDNGHKDRSPKGEAK